jgi:putative endonuclease
MDRARTIASALRPWINLVSIFDRKPPSPGEGHLELGRWGERRAARYLRSRGWKILRRNFRAPSGGEIDLVCRDGDTLVFVEVKTRRSEEMGRPLDAVDERKQRLIRQGALHWLRLLDLPDITFRFDVIEVLASDPVEIRIIESAFTLPDPFRY